MGIKGAIFDLDGTLFDSLWVWSEIDIRFLSKRGLSVPEDYAIKISAMKFKETARYTIERFGLDETPEDLMKEWMDMAKNIYATEIRLKPYAKEFLEALYDRGILLAVATSSAPELYMTALRNNGIEHLFSAKMDTSICRSKEFPDIYLLAAKEMKLSPDECAVFEDLPVALRAAYEAGFKTVVIPDIHTDLEKNFRASFFAGGFKELFQMICKR